jgi:hypothetical protein
VIAPDRHRFRETGLALREFAALQPTTRSTQRDACLADRHARPVGEVKRPAPPGSLTARNGGVCDPGSPVDLRTLHVGEVADCIAEAIVHQQRPPSAHCEAAVMIFGANRQQVCRVYASAARMPKLVVGVAGEQAVSSTSLSCLARVCRARVARSRTMTKPVTSRP